MQEGVDGLLRDKTRPVAHPAAAGRDRRSGRGADATEPPPDEATHWTAPAMAKAAGISPSSVQRIWTSARTAAASGAAVQALQRSRIRRQAARMSSASMSIRRIMPWCSRIDEKSQIQALDRTQPGLPMKKGRCGTMTHDYKRNGTTTLFAALDMLEGKVIGRCMQRHRHQEFIRFLNTVEREVRGRQGGPCDPRQLRHPQAPQGASLARPAIRASPSTSPRPRVSWLNAVEGLFAKLTRQRLKRGVFTSIVELAGRHQPLHRRRQRHAQAVRLDQIR